MKSQENHSVRLEEFLAWVKECEEQYRTASEAVALRTGVCRTCCMRWSLRPPARNGAVWQRSSPGAGSFAGNRRTS